MIISALEAADFVRSVSQLSHGDPFACRILSLYHSYSPELAFVDYWMIADENGICNGAIARNGSNFILFLTKDSDLSEVSSFIRISGAVGVLCSGEFSLDIGNMTVTDGYVMRRAEGYNSVEELNFIIPDIKSTYELLVSCADDNFTPPPFEDFYVDVNHKLRHNAMRLYGIEDKGVLAAAAMTVAESGVGAVLGAVACAPEYRRMGFGSQIVKYITSKLVQENKTVYLHRAANANAAFYHTLGFEECGTWREYRI